MEVEKIAARNHLYKIFFERESESHKTGKELESG